MKKLIAASFLLMIFISQVGYYFFYAYEQHLIRERVREEFLAGIPESSLELFIQDQYGDRIKWEENGKEFYLDGNLYDVAKIKQVNGQTFLYCMNDKKEKELVKEFTKTVRGNHGNGKSEKQTIKNQLSAYIVYKTEIEPLSIFIPSQKFSNPAISFKSSFKEIASPPPKA